MGTNYYHKKSIADRVFGEGTHIGKSSVGWTFSFHATNTIRSFADWKIVLRQGGIIVDEYGREMGVEEFIAFVEDKQSTEKHNHSLLYPSSENYVDEDGYSFSDYEFS